MRIEGVEWKGGERGGRDRERERKKERKRERERERERLTQLRKEKKGWKDRKGKCINSIITADVV